MADVGAAAGVSSQTVSRVVNGRTNVDPATRDRVRAAMRELGYRPNSAARALKYGRFRSIGVVVLSLASHGATRTVNAIAQEAAKIGYSVTLMPIASPTPSAVTGAVEGMGEHSVDGVIILVESEQLDRSVIELPPELPAVLVDASQSETHLVVDNDQGGARTATGHLLDLGHETVWHVAGPAGSHSAGERQAEWRATLEERGLTVPPVLQGDWGADSGYAAGVKLAADPSVTAIFAGNDQMALGVMRALQEAGRRVPEDVSVVGYDDMPESANFLPPLTTVHQYFDRVGVACVEALVAQIERTGEAAGSIIPVELVVRASTAPPRRSEGRG